jgi:segregation and condensation protein A
VATSPLNFQLDSYEGPLDLLLDLIRKQEINIYDIPIARITAQYLDYVQQAASLNIELGAEFIYMAATLIHIKSRMLLPRDPELDKLSPEEDPRRELVDRLLEHEKYKSAAEMLQQKRIVEEAMWSNPGLGEFVSESEEGELAVTLYDLVQTLQAVLDRVKNRPLYEIRREDVSVPMMIAHLRDRMARLDAHDSIGAMEIFEAQRSRRAVICLFLAILEMVRMQAVVLVQKEAFGEIVLKRHKRFEEVAASEEMTAATREENHENVGTA